MPPSHPFRRRTTRKKSRNLTDVPSSRFVIPFFGLLPRGPQRTRMIRSDDVRLDTTRCAHHDLLEPVESSGGESKEKHMGKLDGRIALIAGGDHGIGLVTAKEFVKEGAYVFITSGSDSRLAAAVKEIEAKELHRTLVGRSVAGVQGDVSNAGDLDRVFAQIEREKGKLDVVVAAASETTSDNLAERENRSNGMFATVEKAIGLL